MKNDMKILFRNMDAKIINDPLVKFALIISIQLLLEMLLCELFNKRMLCLEFLIANDKLHNQFQFQKISINFEQ